jgi:hypothetical protein
VSFTIWQNQENFQAWYSGEAFKEAHGGGSLFGFVDMLINATFTLNGAPKPAFWDGLLPLSTQGQMGDKCVENGWRVVDADGRNTLDSEMFVVMNRFQITKGREVDFEQRFVPIICFSFVDECAHMRNCVEASAAECFDDNFVVDMKYRYRWE